MKRITPCFLLSSLKTFLHPSFVNNNTCAVLRKNDNFPRTFANLVDQRQLEGSVAKKKKKVQLVYINLLDSEDNKSIMTLENAEKLAKRRNMILIKYKDFDSTTERPTYKLLSSMDLMEKEISSEISETTEPLEESNVQKLKSSKDIVISGKIKSHDLQVKVNHINRLLHKGHPVKVVVLSPQEERGDISKAIESGIKESGIVHSKVVRSSIIYNLSPLPSNAAATKTKDNNTNKIVK